jgi:hypothetical protein
VFGWISAPWFESQSSKMPYVSKELDTIYETLKSLCHWVLKANCCFPQFSYRNFGLHKLPFALLATSEPSVRCVNISILLWKCKPGVVIGNHYMTSLFLSFQIYFNFKDLGFFQLCRILLNLKVFCFGKTLFFIHLHSVCVDFVTKRYAWKQDFLFV